MRRTGDFDGRLKPASNGPPRTLPPTDPMLSLLSLMSSPAMEIPVGTLTIRNLEDPLKSRLRLRAAARNRSMEEEARQILRAALHDGSLA